MPSPGGAGLLGDVFEGAGEDWAYRFGGFVS